MKKLAVEETFPKNEIAKNMIYNKMKSHYRRVFNAKAKVDTNLPKLPKNSLPLSPEICEVVNRNYYCYKYLPKHRRCLKELEYSEFRFKPEILNTNTGSKLKTLDVYHPPVRTPRRTASQESASQEGLEKQNELDIKQLNTNESEEPPEMSEPKQKSIEEVKSPVIKKETYVQTDRRLSKRRSKKRATFRPTSSRSLNFLRDVTDDVLSKGVYTDVSLEKIFNYHDTMLNEIDRLKDEVGMAPSRPGLRRCSHSDVEALEALESLQLDPTFKEDIINSLRLRASENYHIGLLESQTSSSFLSPAIKSKDFKIEEQSTESQRSSIQERAQSNGSLELKSTMSEVSDLHENDFEEVDKNLIDPEDNSSKKEESESETEKTINGEKINKTEIEINNYNNESMVSNQTVINKENSNEKSLKEEDLNESYENKMAYNGNNKSEDDVVAEEIDEVKSRIESLADEEATSLLRTELNAEIITESVDELDDNVENIEDEEIRTKSEDDKLSKSKEISRSNSSSEMSSIHTESSSKNIEF